MFFLCKDLTSMYNKIYTIDIRRIEMKYALITGGAGGMGIGNGQTPYFGSGAAEIGVAGETNA